MNDRSLECIGKFLENARSLFGTRPYWLVNEHRVVGTFIDAAVATPELLPKANALSPRDICTEASYEGETKVDLVLRPRTAPPLAVEFKGWNIVTKYRPDTRRVEGRNLARGYVDAQLTAVVSDAEKLGRIAARSHTDCLLVVYAQGPLEGDHVLRFAGRQNRARLDFSIAHSVRSAASLTAWATENRGDAVPFVLTHVAASPPFQCAAGTAFSLNVFKVESPEKTPLSAQRPAVAAPR